MELELQRMIGEINKKQRELEEECLALSDLLKPWPKQKNEASKIQPQVDSISVKASDIQKAEVLSRDEQDALLTVERLLHKAHITRQVKPKVKSKAQVDSKLTTSTQQSTNDTCRESSSRQTTTWNDDHLHGTETVRENPQSSDRRILHGDGPKRNTKPANSDRQTCGAMASSAKAGLSAGKTVSASIQSQSHKSASRTHRPLRPASGKNGYVPAHMSAPFKTENVNNQKRRKFPSSFVSKHSTARPVAGSGVSHSTCYKTLPAIKQGIEGKTCQNNNSKSLPAPADEGLVVAPVDNPLRLESSNSGVLSEQCAQFNDGDLHQLVPGSSTSCSPDQNAARSLSGDTQEVMLAGHKSTERLGDAQEVMLDGHKSTDTSQQHEPELFTLRKNGSSLKIPGKLLKLVRTNNSLRQQCLASRLIKRVSHTDSGQRFVERLQGEWTVSEELWTRVRAMTCLRAHKALLKMFEDLHLENLTAQSSYRELYRAKRTLEFILSMFASLQEETDSLAQVEFRPLDQPASPDVASSVSTDTDVACHSPNSAGTSLLFSHSELTNQEVAVQQRLMGCQEWTRLKFEEQFLGIQMRLLELVRQEWWGVLSADERDPAVLQNLYSLVSSGGQFFPTFVTNNQL